MRDHRLKQYNDGAVGVVFCSVCGKEGLQLILEPDCPGKIVSNDLTAKEIEAKQNS